MDALRLLSVHCSLCPFICHSSSLPSPLVSLPASGSFSFGLWLVQIYSFPWWKGRPLGRVPSFSLHLHVLLLLFFCLWSAVYSFTFSALCPGSSPFLPLFAWVPSILFVGGGLSLPLFCFAYRSAFLYCLGLFVPAILCRSSFSSMRYFVVSLLDSEFFPSGCLFPSPLSVPTWFLPCPHSLLFLLILFCFLLVLFLGPFLRELLVFLRSLLSCVFLFHFCWGFFVFFCSCLFCL